MQVKYKIKIAGADICFTNKFPKENSCVVSVSEYQVSAV